MTRRTLFLGAALASGALPGAARATAPGESLRELAKKLRDVYWNVADSGVLIVVAPGKTDVNGFPESAATKIEPTQGKYRLNDLATAFRRRVARFGDVTALIPLTMKVLRPPSDDDIETMDPGQIQQEFCHSLDRSQWTQVGTENGLSGSSLNGRQRALFLAMLPDPIEITPVAPAPAPTPSASAGEPVLTLRGNERLQTRLRMTQAVDIHLMPEGTDGNRSVGFGDAGTPPLARRFQMRDARLTRALAPLVPNQPKPSDLDVARLSGEVSLAPSAPGATLTLGELVDRCAKACRVELYADARMSALPVFVLGESASVSDLLTALTRSVTGTFRRVSDGNDFAFVLTDDRVGIGPRLSTLDWAGRARDAKLHARMMDPRRRDGDDFDPQSLLPLEEADTSPDKGRRLAARIDEERMRGRGPGEPAGFALKDLPPAMRERARALLEKNPTLRMRDGFPEPNGTQTKLRTDRVLLRLEPRGDLAFPGGITVAHPWPGAFVELRHLVVSWASAPRDAPQPAGPPPVWPKAWRTRAALISPPTSTTDPASWDTLFSALAGSRIDTALVEVESDPAARATLAAAVAAGGKHRIAVGVSTRLWTIPKTAPSPGGASTSADVTLFEETSGVTRDWRSAFDVGLSFGSKGKPRSETRRPVVPTPSATEAIADEIAALASTPGLAMVLLRDAFPDGYEGDADDIARGGSRVALGFTPQNRLAFLRRHNVDPIDLPPSDVFDSNYDPPFLSSESLMDRGLRLDGNGVPAQDAATKNPARLWRASLGAQALGGRKAARRTIVERAPNVPLFVAPGQSASFVTSWENEAIDPPTFRPDDTSPSVAARRLGKINWRRIDPADAAYYVPASTKPTDPNARELPMRALLRNVIESEAKDGALTWDGVLLDLTNTPLAEISNVLNAISVP